MYQLRSRPRSRSAGFLRDILRFFETCQTFLDNSLAHVRVSFASISFLQVPPSFLSRYSLVSLASFVVSLVLCVLSGLVLPCATSASFSLTPCTWHPVASHSQWVPLPPIHVPWVHMHNAHACNHKSQAQLTNCITRFMSLCVLTLLIPDIQSRISLSLSLSLAILGCTAVALRAHVVTWDMWTWLTCRGDTAFDMRLIPSVLGHVDMTAITSYYYTWRIQHMSVMLQTCDWFHTFTWHSGAWAPHNLDSQVDQPLAHPLIQWMIDWVWHEDISIKQKLCHTVMAHGRLDPVWQELASLIHGSQVIPPTQLSWTWHKWVSSLQYTSNCLIDSSGSAPNLERALVFAPQQDPCHKSQTSHKYSVQAEQYQSQDKYKTSANHK